MVQPTYTRTANGLLRYAAAVPTATFSHTASTPIDRIRIWDLLQHAPTWANIGPVEDVWDATHQLDVLHRFKWRTTVAGTSHEGSATSTHIAPQESMELELVTKELTGSLGASLSDNSDGGTVITITLSITSRGMLASLFFPAISEAVGGGLPSQVETFVAGLDGPPEPESKAPRPQ